MTYDHALTLKASNLSRGKILEHPEIMNHGETLEELEDNLKDAYKLILMDDVPSDYQLKEISPRCEISNQILKELIGLKGIFGN